MLKLKSSIIFVLIVTLSIGAGFILGRIEMMHEIGEMYSSVFLESGAAPSKTTETALVTTPNISITPNEDSTPPIKIDPPADTVAYYKDSLSISLNHDITKGPLGTYLIRGSIKNNGDRTVKSLAVKVKYFDTNGKAISEHVGFIVAGSKEEDLLKPNYSKPLYFECENAPDEWDQCLFSMELGSLVFQ